jgi:ankyrin repeat protein
MKEKINELFISAIKEQNIVEVVRMAKMQADIHQNNHQPIKLACEIGNVEIVKVLINKGVHLHFNNEEPLRIANNFQYFEIFKLLLETGANPFVLEHEVLRVSIDNKNYSHILLLLEHGYDFDLLNYYADISLMRDIKCLLSQDKKNKNI